VHVRQWARAWAVGEAFGVDPELLNDDRIGRALDAIAPHLEQLAGSVRPDPRPSRSCRRLTLIDPIPSPEPW
jgi:hypothetical protein